MPLTRAQRMTRAVQIIVQLQTLVQRFRDLELHDSAERLQSTVDAAAFEVAEVYIREGAP